jgi:hypothetical protein
LIFIKWIELTGGEAERRLSRETESPHRRDNPSPLQFSRPDDAAFLLRLSPALDFG